MLVSTDCAPAPPAPQRLSDLEGLEEALRISISTKFPGDAEAAGPGTTLGEPLLKCRHRLGVGHPQDQTLALGPKSSFLTAMPQFPVL